ncbi:MAG: hypothetical protein COB09_18695 [Thalassobium sp.]|nr:MAG: hypothetical protein COB09_18695 [Thalassobium sp.]
MSGPLKFISIRVIGKRRGVDLVVFPNIGSSIKLHGVLNSGDSFRPETIADCDALIEQITRIKEELKKCEN